MTLAKTPSRDLATTRSLLHRLIEMPNLERTIQALPGPTFAALIRKVGIEDAGELVAFATTEQLVRAFDEDLFTNAKAGERETFDADRFFVWLEVLLEAGDEVAAERVAELDEDFVAHALSHGVVVLEEDALRDRLYDSDEDEARHVDKALESALTEELDGYILVAKRPNGWDAVLTLILALDRDHRALLVRLLDRLANVTRDRLDDLDELYTVLTEAESLAEDVEAAREERRGKEGHVEPRAAKHFLTLARRPLAPEEQASGRDPVTRAYFRELDRQANTAPARSTPTNHEDVRALPQEVQREIAEVQALAASELAPTKTSTPRRTTLPLTEALQHLSETEPEVFRERMEELAYLANVLVAGHERDRRRMTPKAAADAVLATVGFGIVVELRARRAIRASTKKKASQHRTQTLDDIVDVVRENEADLLFRVASHALANGAAPRVEGSKQSGLLYSVDDLEAASTESST